MFHQTIETINFNNPPKSINEVEKKLHKNPFSHWVTPAALLIIHIESENEPNAVHYCRLDHEIMKL